MKSLRNHLAFIIPLISMLLTFVIYLFTNNVINDYKTSISKDYSIVIVTHTPLFKEKLATISGISVKRIISLKKDKILKKLKKDLSKTSISLLKSKLPFFYKIQLSDFPTSSQLKSIEKELKRNKNIKNIEIFSKNHNHIYLLLVILNKIVVILFIIILLFTVIIISKQVKIWFYENSSQITILKLHGASVLYSGSKIIRQALFSSTISFILVSAIVFFISMNMNLFIPLELQGIINTKINLSSQIINIFFLSYGISFITVMSVLITYKIEND
ncbi:MAG: cell division protein FtsX [Campylobacterales bacterium]|nr:cell division protein FtsX [Campylobacterales bacterium]